MQLIQLASAKSTVRAVYTMPDHGWCPSLFVVQSCSWKQLLLEQAAKHSACALDLAYPLAQLLNEFASAPFKFEGNLT